MKDKLQWAVVIFASLVLGGAAMAGINAAFFDDSSSGGGTAVIQQATTDTSTGVTNTTPSDVADLYDQVSPSVVRIGATNSTRNAGGVGSGVVIDKSGHILTNNHVVDGATDIDVTFSDGSVVTAKLLGTDPGNDLAVIQVDVPSAKLHPATLGDSTKVRAGEFVIAVGNPFDIQGSVTQGIVSGIGRTLRESGGRPLRQLIQSDAAINPGNSGGGLFNSKGQLIGITTAIENPSGDRVFVGIGYAVPVETAKRFLPDMLVGAKIDHPRLGIGLQDVTPAVADSLGLSIDHGVLIASVETNSAAARAGLKGGLTKASPGDIVVSIDGTEIKSYEDLANYIDTKKVGDKVSVKINRAGKEMTVEVTLEAWKIGNSA
ncbi:MAG TPA: trypsin-like peptidase domain-containing protein [Dehalococcoidia bacterium]|nr:trypsin-like peptidase domain-containing protein [Dehalococcoidia bacterium]